MVRGEEEGRGTGTRGRRTCTRGGGRGASAGRRRHGEAASIKHGRPNSDEDERKVYIGGRRDE